MGERDLKELYIIISGKVQGVSFRVWTKRLAQQIGLTGWVKNTSSETVEMCVQGQEISLQKFVKILSETGGPRVAKVQSIEVIKREVDVYHASFEIKYGQ